MRMLAQFRGGGGGGWVSRWNMQLKLICLIKIVENCFYGLSCMSTIVHLNMLFCLQAESFETTREKDRCGHSGILTFSVSLL